MFQERFNPASADRNLLVDDVPAGPAPPAFGGPFVGAWRNYIKTVFKKGFMYKLSCKPSAHFYVAENKTLAGKEDRAYDGEALGRKLAVVFFEAGPGGLFRRVNQETLGMHQELLTLAELLQTVGGIDVPLDPTRTGAQTEVLIESFFQDLEILRMVCSVEPAAPGVHIYSLGQDVNAEAAFALDTPPDHRTKMLLARALQRQQELGPEENLQHVWSQPLVDLRRRAAHLFPAAPAPPAPPAPAKGKGGGRGRGRGRAHAAPPAPAKGKGRGRRGRGGH